MLEISEQLAQQILNYLATKPYAEVFGLVNNIQHLKKIEPEVLGNDN